MDTQNKKTEDMTLKKIGYSKYLLSTLGYGASLAVVQSIAWIVLTSVGLAVYHECTQVETGNVTVSGYFTAIFRFSYYTDFESCEKPGTSFLNDELMISSYELMIWNGVYLGFSTVWLIISIVAVLQMNSWKTIRSKYYYAIAWVTCTLAICILDVILGSFLAKDIHFFQNLIEGKLFTTIGIAEHLVLLRLIIAGIMMTVVFRGFIIWIMNLTFAVYIIYGLVDLRKAIMEEKYNNIPIQHNTLSRGPISAYDNSIEARSTRWLNSESQNMSRPYLHPAKPASIYDRTNSFQGSVNHGYAESTHSYNSRMTQPYGTMPMPVTARNDMPWNNDFPTTPRPDYSPQPMKAVRSALKPVPPTKANNYMR